MSGATPEERERDVKAFETWFRHATSFSLRRDDTGDYDNMTTYWADRAYAEGRRSLEEERWISVEDRLPEKDGTYQVWSLRCQVAYPAAFREGKFWPLEEGCEECNPEPGPIGTGENDGNPVTHWQPSPVGTGENDGNPVTHWQPSPDKPGALRGPR